MIELGEKIILEELISHRVRCPTYHLDPEGGQGLELTFPIRGLHGDQTLVVQHQLRVGVGGVVGLDIDLGEPSSSLG